MINIKQIGFILVALFKRVKGMRDMVFKIESQLYTQSGWMREYIIETANAFDFLVLWLIAPLTFHLFSFDGEFAR